MPITIAKDAGAGAGSDTTYTIRNFQNLVISADTGMDQVGNVTATKLDAILLKIEGPRVSIDFDWVMLEEATTVSSSSTVKTPVEQLDYVYNTLLSEGEAQIIDTYTLTIDFNGSTWALTGVPVKIITTIAELTPLTFNGHITFVVGTVF
jgi:hypothetical protein